MITGQGSKTDLYIIAYIAGYVIGVMNRLCAGSKLTASKIMLTPRFINHNRDGISKI